MTGTLHPETLGGENRGPSKEPKRAWSKEPKRAWSKEIEPVENLHSKTLNLPVQESNRSVRAGSKQSTCSTRSVHSNRSTDVPSLSNLRAAGEVAQELGDSNKKKDFRKRLKNQDTFGVENARSLGLDSDVSEFDYFLAFIGPTILVVVLYAGALCIWDFKYFIPYDSGFAIVLLWCGSMVGGQLALAVGLPPLLGMLCSGMILKNAGDLVRGLPDEWGAAIRAFGLMNILMRGGLEMDLKAVRRLGPAAMRLTVMPGVTEALCVAGTASLIFGMPFALALALGFILGAVSPAVVVGGMFDLQSRGYGVKKGVPSLVVAAASFDDVVAISGFSMCIGLAVGHGDVVMEALHGPINIFAGIGFGLLGAGIACMTKIWDKTWKRSAIVLGLGIIFTFLAKSLHYAGAGALASLVMAAMSSQFWQHGIGGCLSSGADEHFPHEVELDLAKVWRTLAEPLLFSVIGAALDFGSIDMATIPKGIVVVVCGVVLRTVAAFFATLGAGLNFKERLFIALAWMPKATVQAALGSVPLDLIKAELNREEDPQKYDEYTQWGSEILTTAVFAILITAPVGLIVIQQLGPRWLEYGYLDTKPDEAKEIEELETIKKRNLSLVEEESSDSENDVIEIRTGCKAKPYELD